MNKLLSLGIIFLFVGLVLGPSIGGDIELKTVKDNYNCSSLEGHVHDFLYGIVSGYFDEKKGNKISKFEIESETKIKFIGLRRHIADLQDPRTIFETRTNIYRFTVDYSEGMFFFGILTDNYIFGITIGCNSEF